MPFHFQAATHCGMVRHNNEDALAFDEALQLAVLADGMGGYKAGEVASRMATELVMQHDRRMARAAPVPRTGTGADLRPTLETALEAANRAIYRAAQADPDVRRHGHHPGDGSVFQRTVAWCWRTWAIRAVTGCATMCWSRSRAIIRCCRSSSTPGCSRRSKPPHPATATW